MSAGQVVIVLATFNGEQWLADQLRSIQDQSFVHWRMLVSDDGSTDKTLEVLQPFIRDDQRIELLPRRGGRGGHVANFEYLLENGRARGGERFFLADQDDVWESHKLEHLLSLLPTRAQLPALVYSDLELMSADGVFGGSYLHKMNLYGHHDLSGLLRQNALTGCTMAANTGLLDIALPFPPKLQNHDWWLGLCAAALDTVYFCDARLVRYRQHPGNAIGQRSFWRQLSRSPGVLRRQKRVLVSKVVAARELAQRLQLAGLEIPGPLLAYCRHFDEPLAWRWPWLVATSTYRPRSRLLFVTQLLASLVPHRAS